MALRRSQKRDTIVGGHDEASAALSGEGNRHSHGHSHEEQAHNGATATQLARSSSSGLNVSNSSNPLRRSLRDSSSAPTAAASDGGLRKSWRGLSSSQIISETMDELDATEAVCFGHSYQKLC